MGVKCEIGMTLNNQNEEYVGPRVEDRDCIIVENLIDSGKTMIKMADILKK